MGCARWIDSAAPCRLRFGDGLGIDDHPPDLSDYRMVGVAASSACSRRTQGRRRASGFTRNRSRPSRASSLLQGVQPFKHFTCQYDLIGVRRSAPLLHEDHAVYQRLPQFSNGPG